MALVCALGCSFASAENGGEPIPFTEETDNTESTPSVEDGNESPETGEGENGGEGEGGEGENESTPEQGGDSSEDSTQSQPDQTPEEDPSEPSEDDDDDDDETSYVPIAPDKPVDSNPTDESWTTGDISTNYNPNQSPAKGEPKAIRDLSAELSRWMIVTTITAVFCVIGLVLVNKKYSNKKANSRSKKSAGPRLPRY